MENNEILDPLDKIMQELEASNTDSNMHYRQAKELLHRPIVIPPEIKEEPLDGEADPVTTTTATNENCETAELAKFGDSTGGNAKSLASVTATTSKDGSEGDLVGTQAIVTTLTEVVVSTLFTETQQATNEPPATTTASIDVTETLQANTAPTTTSAPNMPLDAAATQQAYIEQTSATSTPHLPLDAQIYIKQENPDDDSEAQNPAKRIVNEKDFGSTENNQATAILPRIKSEPIDPSDVSFLENIPLPAPNQITILRNTVTHAPTGKNVTDKLRKNHNLEDGEIEMDETLPDNFFDDLLQDADGITSAALQSTTAPGIQIKTEKTSIKSEPLGSTDTPELTQSAPIPDNFFDDLLVDHVAERIEDVVNHDLEEKYSERLRELQQLESVDERSNKAHKKHKKKKKKSHKRSHSDVIDDEEHTNGSKKRSKRVPRSRSRSPNTRTINLIENSPEPVSQTSRIRVNSEFMDIPDSPPRSGSLFPHAAAQAFHPIVNLDTDEPTTSAAAKTRRAMPPNVHSCTIRVKSEFATYPVRTSPLPAEDEIPDISLPVQEKELFQRRSSNNRNGLIIDMTTPLGFKRIKLEKDIENSREKPITLLSAKDKMFYARQRAVAAIEALKKGNNTEKGQMVEFVHTTTVRKLPHSSSYYKQQTYENRSPLHNVNNVHYKFNSHANEFNLHEWGLEEMSKVAGKVAKLLGFDAQALSEKLQTVKLPPQLQKVKNECLDRQTDEVISVPQTSFLVTVATQTNEVTVLESAAERRKNLHDIAVEAIPVCHNAATQTTAAICASTSSYDDLPLMRQIKTLNENQLMALSDFAELISEPAATTALDLYRLRQRMIDIYKCAQLPSALEPTTPPMVPPPPPLAHTSHSCDPRIELMATLQESPPPAPPKRQVHISHSSQPAHHNRPVIPAQSRAVLLPAQPRDPILPTVPQKIPVISNVQSLYEYPPKEASKYYGRGGMRR